MYFTRAFAQYTKELSADIYIPLSKDEERELIVKLTKGSKEAKDRMIKAHLRFVVYLLRDFKIPSNIDPMDLVQEGNLGLLDGLSRFDASQFNCRVSTYVQYYIRWYISRALGLYSKSIVIQELPDNFNFEDIAEDIKVEERVHQDILEYIKSFLDSRETKIISLLFGLEFPFKSLSLREVGSLTHLHSERVRQIKNEALDKIKEKQDKIQLIR